MRGSEKTIKTRQAFHPFSRAMGMSSIFGSFHGG
jgi:hypothetical protein